MEYVSWEVEKWKLGTSLALQCSILISGNQSIKFSFHPVKLVIKVKELLKFLLLLVEKSNCLTLLSSFRFFFLDDTTLVFIKAFWSKSHNINLLKGHQQKVNIDWMMV